MQSGTVWVSLLCIGLPVIVSFALGFMVGKWTEGHYRLHVERG
jgi:hypothetical protein